MLDQVMDYLNTADMAACRSDTQAQALQVVGDGRG